MLQLTIVLIIFANLTLPALGEEATLEDLVEVQSAWLKSVNTTTTPPATCGGADGNDSGADGRSPGRKYLCALRATDLGPAEKQGLRAQTENDNLGLSSVAKGLNSGDDKGRTFSGDLRYEWVYENGRKYLQLRSDGFGKTASVNGSIRTPEGERYLEFTEIDRLLIGKEARIEGPFSAVVEGEGQFSSDQGVLAQKIQEFWHHNTDTKVAYTYLDHSKSEVLAAFRAGLKAMKEAEVGRFQCQAIIEAVPGVNTRGQLDGRLRAEINANTGSWGGRTADNPWLAVSAWKEMSHDTWGTWKQEGVKVSTSFQAGKTVATPYFGMAKHQSKIDSLTSNPEKKDEPIFLMGILVEY